ncbi:MAG: nucleotidyltransferase family protein [Clostridia bacterium]|nr:nucleotidyltransferase family protein [Clostridia bacterium]
MLDIQQQGIITLVRNAILGEKNSVSQDFKLSDAVAVARKHQIINILYYGALQAGLPQDETMQQLFMLSCMALSKSEQQMFEINRICTAFNERGIEYMPLKGTLLKYFYPKADMRAMGDADILIKPRQYDLIKPILTELGFTEKLESDHELTWAKPALYLELHKRVIPSYNKDYYEYFGDGWRLARPCEEQPNRYEMSAEDALIYLFTHFAKHYRDGGIGIRHMTDLWIYRRVKSELDETYIKKELKKLQLWEFYKNVMDTLQVWFGSAEPTDKTDFITGVIFGSGAYGTHEAHITASAVKLIKTAGSTAGARRKKVLNVLFPKCKNMAKRYPVLEKAPVLLPVFWVVRGAETLLFSSRKLKDQKADMQILTDENISDFQKALDYVGLDFNFKED